MRGLHRRLRLIYYEFNEQLILNLKFTRSPIDKIAQQFNFIPDVMQGKKPFEGKDAEFIEDYFANLGKTDALSQIDYLALQYRPCRIF